MATMHDVLDAQWMYDNFKDGKEFVSFSRCSTARMFYIIMLNEHACRTMCNKKYNNDGDEKCYEDFY